MRHNICIVLWPVTSSENKFYSWSWRFPQQPQSNREVPQVGRAFGRQEEQRGERERGRESRSMATTAGVRLAAETLYKEDWRGFWIHQYQWNHGIHQGWAWKYFVILISLSDPSFFEDVLLNDENAMGISKVRALGTRHQQASWHSCRGEFLRSHMPKCPCFLWSFFPDVSVS